MTKSHFWKLLCCGYFPGNFSQYLRAALSPESYTSRWLFWIELYTVISLIFSCVQRNRRIITVVFVIMECKTSSKLIMYLMKLWCSPLFLENFNILEKNCTKMCETEKRRGYCETVRNAVKLSDTRWNCESWDVWYYEVCLILWGKKSLVYS